MELKGTEKELLILYRKNEVLKDKVFDLKTAHDDLKAEYKTYRTALDENVRLTELVNDACSHMSDCECQCMDYRAIRQTANTPQELLDLIKKSKRGKS